MSRRSYLGSFGLILLAAGALAACSGEPGSLGSGVAVAAESTAAAQEKLPAMVVHKNASCGCCGLWVEHMRQAGFTVEVRDVDNLAPIKETVGVPYGMGSCHTAQVGGYFIEGHVPAADVLRLLREKPQAKGLTVPGMPLGSPGMETPSGQVQPYEVHLVNSDGTTSTFARHGGE